MRSITYMLLCEKIEKLLTNKAWMLNLNQLKIFIRYEWQKTTIT